MQTYIKLSNYTPVRLRKPLFLYRKETQESYSKPPFLALLPNNTATTTVKSTQ